MVNHTEAPHKPLTTSGTASLATAQNAVPLQRFGQIVRSLIAVAPLYALVALAVVIRELFVAREFGVSNELDAFLMAYLIAAFCVSIAAGPFNAAVIPSYIRVKNRRGLAEAQVLFSNILTFGIGLLAALTILLLATFPFAIQFLARGFSQEKRDLTTHLFFILAPYVIMSGISTIFTAVLNAGERFALGAMVPAITSISIIIALTAWHGHVSVNGLAAVVVFGASIEVVLLAIAITRAGVRPIPRWVGLNSDLSEVFHQYGTMVVGTLLMSLTVVVDQSMASWLGPGAVSELSYGGKAVGLAISILSLTVGTVVMPYFSRLVAAENWSGLNNALMGYLRIVLVATLPALIFLVLFSTPIVTLIFQHGRFRAEDTRIVAQIQRAFALQIPFYVAGTVVVRAIAAMGANRILAIGAAFNLTLNVLLNWILMSFFGTVGIAASTTLVYVFSFVFALTMLRRVLSRSVENHGLNR